MKEKLSRYLHDFLIENCWDYKIPEQARALFTTLCFVGNIDAGTAECDRILNNIYYECGLEEQILFDDFDLFMCGLIA